MRKHQWPDRRAALLARLYRLAVRLCAQTLDSEDYLVAGKLRSAHLEACRSASASARSREADSMATVHPLVAQEPCPLPLENPRP